MNTKKIMITLYFLALNFAGFAQLKYEVTGIMKSVPGYKVTVTLYYSSPLGQFVTDTCSVKDGKFRFSGEVSRPTPAFLAITDGEDNLSKALGRGATDKNAVKIVQNGIYLESGKITALLDHEKQADAVITGTANNNALQDFRPMMNKYKALESSIYARNKAVGSNSAKADILLKEYNYMVSSRAVEIAAIIKKSRKLGCY
ncbi:DUF4369 domain-containing protein [Pedobacter sp. P26]|uniref:DUF4369 domain-containing protein n=1 Tax=Pedobacter sp. P26 TaxID=3423956 RepID=UPI003D678999